MRDTKFRCWDKFQKKYIFEGFHIVGEVTCFSGMEHVIDETWKERSAAMSYTSTLESWNDFEFEMFIGRQDDDDKDIYEGDIVKYEAEHEGLDEEEWETAAIEWDNEGSRFILADGYDTDLVEPTLHKVVGNIHENPELVKEN